MRFGITFGPFVRATGVPESIAPTLGLFFAHVADSMRNREEWRPPAKTAHGLRFVLPSMRPLLILLPLLSLAFSFAAKAAEPVAQLPVTVVDGGKPDDLIGPYNQPRWSARGRFSSDTDVYVLPPFEAYLDLDYEMTKPRHDKAIHLFTQELEIGLPHRFQLAYENAFEFRGGRGQETMHTIEGRWALADWGEIPLNPTFFAEYKFGVGREPAGGDAADAADAEEGDAPVSNTTRRIPNAVEFRLLLGQQFGEKTQWALNLFHERETGGDREHETGFSQALSYAVIGEQLRVGAEMQFIRRTDAESRGHAAHEFDIGPSFSYKPNKRVRLDMAALFGTNHDSPDVKLFAVVSINLNSSASDQEISAPVSTQNR